MSEVTHVVLVDWKANTSPETIESARALCRSLPEHIGGIVSLAEGPSVSPEHLEAGFEFGLVIVLGGAEARDAYLVHPAHLPLAALLQSWAERLVVFDI